MNEKRPPKVGDIVSFDVPWTIGWAKDVTIESARPARKDGAVPWWYQVRAVVDLSEISPVATSDKTKRWKP